MFASRSLATWSNLVVVIKNTDYSYFQKVKMHLSRQQCLKNFETKLLTM